MDVNGNGIVWDPSHNMKKWAGVNFSRLLYRFQKAARLNQEMFHICNMQSMVDIASKIDDIDLPIRVRYKFCMAPANQKDNIVMKAISRCAKHFQQTEEVPFELHIPARMPRTPNELEFVETLHKAIDCYLWLAQSFPDRFPQLEEAMEKRKSLTLMIDSHLKKR